MHIVKLLNTASDLVTCWYFGWTFHQPSTEWKQYQNVQSKVLCQSSLLMDMQIIKMYADH